MYLRLLSVTLLSLTHASAFAECVQGERSRLATVSLTSCEDVASVAEARLGENPLPWVKQHVDHILKSNPGVVIEGTIVQKVYVIQYSDSDFVIEETVAADEAGEWFLPDVDANCANFTADETIDVYVTDHCCDDHPPSGIPCLLDLGQAYPVPEALEALVAQ